MSTAAKPENAGVGNFLDRLEAQLNEESGADSLAAQRDANPTPEPTEVKPEGDLDGLRGASVETKADPLNDLSGEAHKGQAPTSKEDEKTPTKKGDHEDILSEFDEADQVKLRAYLDSKVAEELQLTETAGGAFKRLKSENRELEGKIAELETRTAEPEALKAATERIQELEALVNANEEANSVLRLEDTEAYREAVTRPQQEILAASDTIADRYGVSRDDLANILGNPNRRELSDSIGKLLGDDVADADKFELYDLSRRAEATFTKKADLFQNADAALKEAEELAGKSKERAALADRQAREVVAKETIDRLKEKASFVLDIVGKDTVENFVVANAERPVGALSPADQAFARFAYDALIPLAKHVRKLEDELQTANDDNIKLRGSTPGGSGVGSGGGGRTSDDTAPDGTPSSGIGSAVDRIGSALGVLQL